MQNNMEKPVILAVDDKPELLTAVVSMLEDKFRVIGVTSGVAALKALERFSPKIFLLDIEMPGMSGYELAHHIRRQGRFAATPIIFLTAKNDANYIIAAIKNGGNDYVLKPVEKDVLLAKIRQHTGLC